MRFYQIKSRIRTKMEEQAPEHKMTRIRNSVHNYANLKPPTLRTPSRGLCPDHSPHHHPRQEEDCCPRRVADCCCWPHQTPLRSGHASLAGCLAQHSTAHAPQAGPNPAVSDRLSAQKKWLNNIQTVSSVLDQYLFDRESDHLQLKIGLEKNYGSGFGRFQFNLKMKAKYGRSGSLAFTIRYKLFVSATLEQ